MSILRHVLLISGIFFFILHLF